MDRIAHGKWSDQTGAQAYKYESIVFTNMQGNILEGQIDESVKLQCNRRKYIHYINIEEQNMSQLGQDLDSTGSN